MLPGGVWGQMWNKGVALGLSAGALFAVSAVSYRGASLEIAVADPIVRAGVTLGAVTTMQMIGMGMWLWVAGQSTDFRRLAGPSGRGLDWIVILGRFILLVFGLYAANCGLCQSRRSGGTGSEPAGVHSFLFRACFLA